MTGTTLEKTGTVKTVSKFPSSKKGKMTYDEALDVVQSCDAVIKEAAKNRTVNTVKVTHKLVPHAAAKFGVVSIATVIWGMAGYSMGMLPASDGATISIIGCLGLFGAPLSLQSVKMAKIVSPLYYKKLMKKYQMEQQLVDLKESEFAQIEEKVLKKSQKARNVINEALKYENRGVVYHVSEKHAGFSLSELAPLGDWELEKLRRQKAKIQGELSASAMPAPKMISAG